LSTHGEKTGETDEATKPAQSKEKKNRINNLRKKKSAKCTGRVKMDRLGGDAGVRLGKAQSKHWGKKSPIGSTLGGVFPGGGGDPAKPAYCVYAKRENRESEKHLRGRCFPIRKRRERETGGRCREETSTKKE